MSFIRLGWPVSNVWLLPETPVGPVLIDSGLPQLWPAIRWGLRRHGLLPSDLAAVFLTHRHSDHAGNAARLEKEHGVRVFAHPADGEILCRTTRPPRLKAQGHGVTNLFCRVENWFPASRICTQPIDVAARDAGFEVYWVPGHTRGSVFLFHPGSGTLFSGDMLLNAVPPLTTRTRLCLPHPPFCDDHTQALKSLAEFQKEDLDIRLLCPGHGPPLSGPVNRELGELLERSVSD